MRFILTPVLNVAFNLAALAMGVLVPSALRPNHCVVPSNLVHRQRMESLRDALGWGNLETDEDKVWQQLLLH